MAQNKRSACWIAGCHCDVSKWHKTKRTACWMLLWSFKMAQIWNRHTTSFLDFSRLEHAQATREHTEHPNNSIRKHLLRRCKTPPVIISVHNYCVQLQNLIVITIKFGCLTPIIISIWSHSHISSLLHWIVFINIYCLIIFRDLSLQYFKKVLQHQLTKWPCVQSS